MKLLPRPNLEKTLSQIQDPPGSLILQTALSPLHRIQQPKLSVSREMLTSSSLLPFISFSTFLVDSLFDSLLLLCWLRTTYSKEKKRKNITNNDTEPSATSSSSHQWEPLVEYLRDAHGVLQSSLSHSVLWIKQRWKFLCLPPLKVSNFFHSSYFSSSKY